MLTGAVRGEADVPRSCGGGVVPHALALLCYFCFLMLLFKEQCRGAAPLHLLRSCFSDVRGLQITGL